jgi:hypothetical protein
MLHAMLSFADERKRRPIEQVLNKGDLEVGIEFLYLTGGQMIQPRRPVLRTRNRCPPMVVM